LLIVVAVMGQKKPKVTAASGKKKSKITLISSTTLEYLKNNTIAKVHNGVFQQDYSILRSDSAYSYTDKNMVDAFGHVNINQGDTLNIFSDKLNYDGNTKQAILTGHVKMVDKDVTLTTEYLTYNTATRIATYVGGGKLVNKDNTLTSINGYYFSFSRDAYFRYNVVCKTPDALIKTDTLRYNSGTRISYFYGPTHIYGTKDKDTLYTEDGTYNTVNEQARFGKKNLYSQGTKTLKGDSLFYDRLKGYGRAVKHITFNDNEQKTTLRGDLGEFYKDDDRAIVTQNAYAIFVVEEKDTTKTDSVAQKLTAPGDKNAVNKKSPAQTKTDSVTLKRLGLASAAKKPPVQTKTDSVTIKRMGLGQVNKKPTVPSSTVKTDAPASKTPPAKKTGAGDLKGKTDTTHKTKPGSKVKDKADTLHKLKADTLKRIKSDSLYMAADTLETQILTWKELKKLQRDRFEANNRDTSIKIVKHLILTKAPKVITIEAPKMPVDTSFYHKEYFGKPKPKPVPPPVKKKQVKPIDPKKLAADSIRNKIMADSLEVIANHGLKDTSRVRIISGHHHSKIFKSDLQAKSDSMFYSYADSTIRMYVKPMIWTQGSQLSGDTIYLRMKNRKLDNMDLFPNAFVVNIEKNDSLHFNQMGGTIIHGTFKDSKLNSLLVTGNAETIAFTRDSATNKVTDMMRSLSSRFLANFVKGEFNRVTYYVKPDIRALPFKDAKEEDKILKGFIWKPKDRPVSKESIIGSYKPPVVKKPASTKGPIKGTVPVKSKTTGKPKPGDKVTTTPPGLKMVKDSALIIKLDTAKKLDTLKKIPAAKPKAGQ